jgi:uncharacterized membrane protein
MLLFMGGLHFVAPTPFEKIVPRWLSNPGFWVGASGVAELASGALLAVPRTRRVGGYLAAATIVAVYPANIQMALDAGMPDDAMGWFSWLRLPLQIPLFRWALKQTR